MIYIKSIRLYIWKVLNEIDEEIIASKTWDIPEEKMELLIYHFRKVMAYSDTIADAEALSGFRKKLNDFIESLTMEQKDELLMQLKNFVNVFYYYYKRFADQFTGYHSYGR